MTAQPQELRIPSEKIRLATRGSQLALWQTRAVMQQLQRQVSQSDLTCEIVVVSTQGDRDQRSSLSQIGGKGVFVKEIQAAVLRGEADMAVHSAKDLPAATPDGLTLAAVLKRADPRDVLAGGRLDELPAGAVVATGAPRRRALLARHRPDLELRDLRGNIATRLAAIGQDGCAAVMVAAAALERLGDDCELPAVMEYLEPREFVPQVGQGAIAVECRADDAAARQLLDQISHVPTMRCLQAERGFLGRLQGDCNLPAGAFARFQNPDSGTTDSPNPDSLGAITGFLDGAPRNLQLRGELWDNPVSLGEKLADGLLSLRTASPTP